MGGEGEEGEGRNVEESLVVSTNRAGGGGTRTGGKGRKSDQAQEGKGQEMEEGETTWIRGNDNMGGTSRVNKASDDKMASLSHFKAGRRKEGLNVFGLFPSAAKDQETVDVTIIPSLGKVLR